MTTLIPDPQTYPQQLAEKRQRVSAMFKPYGTAGLEVFPSTAVAFRMRAEFRVWHDRDDLFYAMFDPEDRKTPLRVEAFPIVSARIQKAMPHLLDLIKNNIELRRKLFQVEFLSTLAGELLITLIYHRQLKDTWEQAAQELAETLDAQLIGRSRKQKRTLGQGYVTEVLTVKGRDFSYRQYEQGFTQPNAQVNMSMLEWACDVAQGAGQDLLELYCGNGNFTLPLSHYFRRVLATEVSRTCMAAARENAASNNIENIALVRLSAEDVCQALQGDREFRRLKELGPLSDFEFSTIFVDPPRVGLDPLTEQLVSQFDHIIYISCNPQTLQDNLATISRTHQLERCAMFDQFPYTEHVECGAYLKRR